MSKAADMMMEVNGEDMGFKKAEDVTDDVFVAEDVTDDVFVVEDVKGGRGLLVGDYGGFQSSGPLTKEQWYKVAEAAAREAGVPLHEKYRGD
jgi:hypothetical protein